MKTLSQDCVRIVSNFGNGDSGAGEIFSCTHVYYMYVRIAKIGDYSKCSPDYDDFSVIDPKMESILHA